MRFLWILAMTTSLAGASARAATVQMGDTMGRPITVDGSFQDWPAVQSLVLNRKDQVTIGGDAWTGPATLSATIFVSYDQNFLYVGALVKTPAPLM